jgi:histidinol phosphatase-like PHP family hydrolase
MYPTRINLHAHTTYSSDAVSRMDEMAEAARQNRHCCLCVTDHDRMFIQNPKIFMKQLREAEHLSKAMNFPIIVGMEITLPPVKISSSFILSEEALLFGHRAIIKWLDFHQKGPSSGQIRQRGSFSAVSR